MEYLAHIADDGREQTVGEHLRSAAEYASRALAPAGLCEAGYLCALLHDCGKYTELFDRYIHSNGEMRRGSVNHTFSGVRLIMERCHHEPPISLQDIAGELLAYAVGAHHGEFNIADEDGKNGFYHRMKKEDIGYEEAVSNYTELCADTEELDRRFKAACDEVTPIFGRITDIAADNSEVSFYVGMLSRLLLSAVIEGDRRDTAEFMSGVKRKDDEIPDWNELLDSVEKKILDLPANTPVNVARRNISEQCRLAAEAGSGVYRLNVPTGAGKTLSALRYALAHAAKNGMRRVIFTSPLLSILDQNAEVIRKFVGDDSLILEHHSNVVRDSADGEALDKYELLAENWSAPIIITTMVQLLNTLFSDKTSCIRRFQALCGSVIVIDEVQTVPCKMLSLFNLAVNFLSQVCRATVLLCSATQPCLEQTRHPLIKQPADIVPYDKKLRDVFKRTDIIFDGSRTLDELAARLDELLNASDSLLIVCNLKKQAEFLFGYMKSNHGDCLVFHLSAGMCIAHRRAAIEKLRQALAACGDKKVICVSTQVIEAGVDISFGCVVRLAAGLDSVIQSAGRCNRNGELDSPAPVYLISCADENLAGLGDIKAQKDALNQLLTEYSLNPQAFDSDLASDNSVGRYYRALYAAMPDRAQDYPTKHGFTVYDLLADNDAFSGRCGENDLFAMRQAFKTAGSEFNVFDSNGVDVIVPYGGGAELISELMSPRAEHDITYLHSLCERAKPYTVSVYSHQQRMLEEAGGIYPAAGGAVRVLSAANYDSDVGVILEPDINSFIV